MAQNGRNLKESLLQHKGYTQVIGTKKLLKAAAGRVGLLAYKEKNKEGFTTFTKKKQEIDPGPLYLVWSNFTAKDKFSHGDELKWPYQLKTIALDY
jgi:hypothetical protein